VSSSTLRGTRIDVTVEAIVLDRRRVLDGATASEAAGVGERLDALRAAGVHVADARSGAAGRRVVRRLARRGVTGELVLVIGAARPELPRAATLSGGSVAELIALLDDQLGRRRDRRVPSVDADPAWTLELPTDPARTGVAEALGSLANGRAGSRGAREEDGPGSAPLFAVGGAYTADPVPGLLAGPRWEALTVMARHGRDAGKGAVRRAVDLRTGVLVRAGPDGVRTLRFLSAARPYAMALRAEGPAADLGDPGVAAPAGTGGDGGERVARRRQDGVDLVAVGAPGGPTITVAARDRVADRAGLRRVERVAAWAYGPHGPRWARARERLRAAERVGYDGLLAEHRAAWARLWADARVDIEGTGADDDQLAARLALLHLLAAAGGTGEAAVGPRGLTGHAYGGHVFWDADAFVLPALAAIRPPAARAVLEYRLRRLPAARALATERGSPGARFPWESAATGADVTPATHRRRNGVVVPVRTGAYEDHVVADVAWAADHYAAWTGDAAFLTGPGRPLLVEAARWWAGRIRRDADGRGHIDRVIGPDEYHGPVDDNAFTNVMARWNLRRAAEVAETGGDLGAEPAAWRALADTLVDGYDPRHGRHEQFAGYDALEPVLATDLGTPPIAASVLLGDERLARAQLLKQADVVMAHHLVPDEMAPGSLAADLAYYLPRTSHGSSTSPAVYATQLARAGRPDEALPLFRLAARLDIDDLTGTTADGLHLATFGGVWQALARGFLGLSPGPEALRVDPRLPAAWDALALRLRYHGVAIGVRADHRTVTITCRRPVNVAIGRGPPTYCPTPGRTFPLADALVA
jgi:hypothetical protein